MTYLMRHLQVLFTTLGNMARSPISSFNSIAITAITLLLPAALYIIINSAQQLTQNWQGRPQMSVFLEPSIDTDESQLIFQEIQLHPLIAVAEYISPAQAMQEFKLLSGLDKELDFLDENPLPISIVAMPSDENINKASLLNLKQQLSKIDGIKQIRLDLDWTDRFNAILQAVTRGAQILSLLLAFALILIVGNTIRLIILNRRDEIKITKLVGGTDSFIRRPFLYYGALIGVLGAITALILLYSSLLLLQPSLNNLSALYGNIALVYWPNIIEVLILVIFGGFLGWIAARLSVAQHLHEIEPR